MAEITISDQVLQVAASNTSDSSERAGYIAGNHFGLGLRPGELRYINSDPRGWLKSQLDNIENSAI